MVVRGWDDVGGRGGKTGQGVNAVGEVSEHHNAKVQWVR